MALRPVAIGFRSKTAKAPAVVVGADPGGAPVLIERLVLATSDPRVPASHQPHHAGLGLEASDAKPIVAAAERAVRDAARRAFAALRAELRERGLRVIAVGVVGPPPKDPNAIGNPHMRAHAAEGQLFRAVLEASARGARLPCQTLSDREPWEEAAARLGTSPASLRGRIQRLGKGQGPPWRLDQQVACAAGWLAWREAND